mgnify:CR=1 FL=1
MPVRVGVRGYQIRARTVAVKAELIVIKPYLYQFPLALILELGFASLAKEKRAFVEDRLVISISLSLSHRIQFLLVMAITSILKFQCL